jgi:hypothetical protein
MVLVQKQKSSPMELNRRLRKKTKGAKGITGEKAVSSTDGYIHVKH